MVRQYYVPQVTELSEQELQSVFAAVEPPMCLLGGWAVHFHVNPGFQREYGRGYIGSRDIDIGVHIDPDWNVEGLRSRTVGSSLTAIQELGYTESRFGFVQNFHRDTQERISEAEASQYDMHEIFQVYVDVIPDTEELEDFKEAFGFKPPSEPLLQPVFKQDLGEPLSQYVSWPVSDDARIVPPELLAAMKVRSLPDRDKSHKRVKDVADLHALLWYVRDYNEIRSSVQEHITDSDLERLNGAVGETVFESAAQLLQIDSQLVSESLQRLFR